MSFVQYQPSSVGRAMAGLRKRPAALLGLGLLLVSRSGLCDTATNLFAPPFPATSLPDTGPSLLRVFGALALVVGLFLGGVWLVRNGRFTNLRRSRSTRLTVLETRSLGARQAICVVAYGAERFLIGSTPAGINLLSHLAPGSEAEPESAPNPAGTLPFAQALAQVLGRPRSAPGKPEVTA